MGHDNKEMLVPADVIIIYLSSAGTHSGSVSGSHNLFYGSLCSVYSTIIKQTISTTYFNYPLRSSVGIGSCVFSEKGARQAQPPT